MRITCDVEVVNRLLPAFNLRGKNKATRSQLSVGRKPGADNEGDIYLMICTKQDRNGAKYRVIHILDYKIYHKVVSFNNSQRPVHPPFGHPIMILNTIAV